jgi:hypothetical protein
VSQLDPGDPRQLAGQDVVLEPADPAIGLAALAPGTAGPIDRSALLAVGLGTEATGQGLRAITLPWTVLGCALAALGAAWALARTPPANGLVVSAGAAVAWGGIVVAARAWRIDLPLEAIVPVIGVPLVARLAGTTRRALRALDQVALRLGAPTPTTRCAPGSTPAPRWLACTRPPSRSRRGPWEPRARRPSAPCCTATRRTFRSSTRCRARRSHATAGGSSRFVPMGPSSGRSASAVRTRCPRTWPR